jgi:D-methionine transport system substrate-binding protein
MAITRRAVAAAVHVEPLGLYSRQIRRLADLQSGSSVAVPNDITNLSRALYLLQDQRLLRLRPGLNERDRQLATPHDIAANPLQLRIIQVRRGRHRIKRPITRYSRDKND